MTDVEQYARSPHEKAQATGEPADDLLRLGCLLYGGDDIVRHAEARALVADHPELAGATISGIRASTPRRSAGPSTPGKRR